MDFISDQPSSCLLIYSIQLNTEDLFFKALGVQVESACAHSASQLIRPNAKYFILIYHAGIFHAWLSVQLGALCLFSLPV